MDPQAATGRVSVTYDPELVSADDVVGRGEAAGCAVEGVADRSDRATFEIPEMDCPSCTGKVETALVAAEGVEAVEIRPTAGTVLVRTIRTYARGPPEAIEGVDIALVGDDLSRLPYLYELADGRTASSDRTSTPAWQRRRCWRWASRSDT